MLRGFSRGWPLLAAGLLVLSAGCPSGTTFEDEEAGTGASATGAGGDIGTGGTATTSPCAQDCSIIQTPTCYVSVCNEGAHPGPVGTCVVVPDDNGTACDDGMFCTVDDACADGVCVGGPQNDCGTNPGPCDDVVCNEASQSCSTTPKANGSACTPTDLCQIGATCNNGLCVGTTNDCFFEPVPDECHVAVCNPATGMCEPEPGNEGQPCTDLSDLCTVGKTCSAGVCTGGQPMNCSAQTVGCNIGVCDTTTGQCVGQPVMNGDACDDLNHCTVGELCNGGVCGGGTTITQCINGDNCCATGCNETNDDDCGNDLLLLYSDSLASAQDVQAKLVATGAFPVVDMLSVQSSIPSLGALINYDVVLTWSNYTYADPVAMGNLLADFFDQGGRVVQATFSACTNWGIQGRWHTQGYKLLDGGSNISYNDSLGTVLEPSSPLMFGVTQLSASSAFRCTGALVNGAVAVANWTTSNHPLVVRGVINGRPRADVNMFPPSSSYSSSYWTGHGAELLRNALLYK